LSVGVLNRPQTRKEVRGMEKNGLPPGAEAQKTLKTHPPAGCSVTRFITKMATFKIGEIAL
jgi:hypothetical protein